MAKLNDKQLENLKKVYLSAREKLLDTIINYQGVGTKTYYNTVLKQLNAEIERLNTETNFYINTEIPKEYQTGIDEVYSYFIKNNLMMNKPSMFANIHMDAVYALSREMQYQVQEGIAQAGRQVIRYLDESRDNALRAAGLEATAEKVASGSTIQDMKNNLVEKLQDEGFMTVQYGQGKNAYQVSLDSYASMVARSTTREAGNLARENQLIDNDYDLVQMSTHYPTCHICAKFQGRVYSISGKDKRFPPLSQAFASGYRNIHPNCRHIIVPWIENLQTNEEIALAIIDSNQPFIDIRDQKQINLYNKQQKQNRQMRQDLYQYERYKQRLGNDVPKTFSAFRRMKKAGGDNWGVLESQYKGMGYYNKAIKNEPDITKVVTDIADKLGIKTAGLEYKIKSKESYLRKIKSNYIPGGTEYEVKDILRYTYISPSSSLSEKTLSSIVEYNKKVYNTIEIKNYWLDDTNPYNGINTTLTAPNGQKFEMQYHTPESFELKDGKMHDLYEKSRLIEDRVSPEYIKLRNEMFDLSDGLTVPYQIERVEDKK
ncbi:hypothetical protein GC105_09160 [Alkalibaculum sp. M08DMB]|uniref:Minor capsid protein n=1 Tax=Alkalibaculum sporogenes TaxID=2655001 RepID=A0A6A7K906_9FIRM|nr:phage minor capsid protein [Alkalibaculum sporogenes]MPW25958.1 hypothetical protein [Alkalibaculum sporogenes]